MIGTIKQPIFLLRVHGTRKHFDLPLALIERQRVYDTDANQFCEFKQKKGSTIMPLQMLTTLSRIFRETVDDYLSALQAGGLRPTPETIELDILNLLAPKISALNDEITKGSKIKIPTSLPPYIIARVVAALWHVCKIPLAGAETNPDYDVPAIYQESGPNEGIYVTSELEFEKLFSQFNRAGKKRDFEEFTANLRRCAERKLPCYDKDLIAVNNGIFDYLTKQLQPFDPDLVFLSKSHVNYVPNPTNPVIHNPDDNTDWDVETWMRELSDDPEIVKLLWQTIGAILRPNVRWDKAVFFYSTVGNNGKGTLCVLMRNLCGPGTCCSISLADFGKDFQLEPLTQASANIVDENDVGDFSEKNANFKAVITSDVIQINRKFKQPIAFRFRGLMVQCLNDLPRAKDKSESFYRRLLFVPFTKCFTGAERKYIKADYLGRPEVLEYVLWRVLHMDYWELSNPAACQAALVEYKEANDPLRQFVDEIFPQLAWDFVPLAYLFDLYSAWFKRFYPGGRALGKQNFNRSIFQLQAEIPGWTCPGLGVARRPGNDMDKPEPLSREYNLTTWLNPACPDTKSPSWTVPCVKQNYKGYFIRSCAGCAGTNK